MKKKIKDLTIEEARDICKSQIRCALCPLNAKNINCYLMYLESKEYWNKQREVEIML